MSVEEIELNHLLEIIRGTTDDILLMGARDDGQLDDRQLMAALSPDENEKAARLSEAEERRHYLFRRCLQRVFTAQVIGWRSKLSHIPLVHALDRKPFCQGHQNLQFSFSSSHGCYLFGVTQLEQLGVDIERVRRVENVVELADRFFTLDEAAAIENAPGHLRDVCFLELWSAKEAGLKAVGLGVDAGLNLFTFSRASGQWRPCDIQWTLTLPHWQSDYIVTVMHSAGAPSG